MSDFLSKVFFDIISGDRCIFDGVMKKTGNKGSDIRLKFE
jgi:hypothetical protein